jgi:hypothetical protein
VGRGPSRWREVFETGNVAIHFDVAETPVVVRPS